MTDSVTESVPGGPAASGPATGRPEILLFFAEALSAPEALFSLRRAGFRLRLAAREGARVPVAAALGLPCARIAAPEADFARAVEGLRAAAAGADALFAVDDAALALANAAFAEGEGPLPLHATGAQARAALDKRVQIEAARAAGLAVPPTIMFGEGAPDVPAESVPESVRAPAIVKPAMAARVAGNRLTRGGARYLLDAAELAGFAAKPEDGPLLLQPLIRGTGEGVFGFATAEGVVEWSGHERVRMMNPHGSGSSACRARDPEPELRARVGAMMTALGWRGPFMVELLRDADGTPWFMELNGRLWGSMALARRNGFEYPAWAAEAGFDPGFRPVRGPERLDEARHLGREILHLMFLARGPRTAFHRAGWPAWRASLAGALRLHGARGFYNHDPDLPRFFLRDAWETVADATWRRGR